jgi:hypothetical protein
MVFAETDDHPGYQWVAGAGQPGYHVYQTPEALPPRVNLPAV